mgnify:CR=1 FL=1
MGKELSAAEKSRRTKLSKKSVEELVNIILRKDDVERRKDNLIKALKINIQGLEKKVEAISNDIANAETEYNELKRSNFNAIKANANFKTQLEDSEYQIKKLNKIIQKSNNSDIKMFAIGGVIGIIIMVIVAHIF